MLGRSGRAVICLEVAFGQFGNARKETGFNSGSAQRPPAAGLAPKADFPLAGLLPLRA